MKKLQEISRVYRVERVRENMDLYVDAFEHNMTFPDVALDTIRQHRSTSTLFSNRNVLL
jgi:hypothetical protein